MSAARRLPLLALASLVISCGGGTKQTAPKSIPDTTAPTSEATPDRPPTVPLTGSAEAILVLFEDLAHSVRAAGSDCGKYAAAMTAWTSKNESQYAKLRAEVGQMQLPASEETRFDDRLTAAMTSVVEAASSCGNNEQAWASFQRWDALMESE